MLMKTKFYLMMLLSVLLVACEKALLEEEFGDTPYGNFEVFWQEFDQAYGAMQAKNLNWDSLKVVYGNSLNESTNDEELFGILSGLLNTINDGHADLLAPGIGYFRSWKRRDKSYYQDFNTQDLGKVGEHQAVIRREYLNNQFQSTTVDGWFFFYGSIEKQNQTIGYLCVPTFNLNNFPDAFMQSAVDTFQDLDAVIIDLRWNGGGTNEAFVKTLNKFASQPTLFLKSKYRNSPGHGDFSEMLEHHIRPQPNCLKDKPVAILMNSFTASSSEHFILGMKTQKDIITVGDTTCGAFSSVNERLLPNGWKFRLGGQILYTPKGNLLIDENGNYLEGIGLAPDYYVSDQWNHLKSGLDMPLEKAIDELTK
jgi:carboxyl-terminal processing protease